MAYYPGSIYYKQIASFNVSGVSTNLDFVPWATLNRNGLDDSSQKVFVNNIDLGRYVASGNIPLTYSYGDNISITVSGYMSGLFTKSIIDIGIIDKQVNSLNSISVTGTAPPNFIVPNSVSPGVTVSVTGVVGVVNTVNTVSTVSNPVSVNSITPGLTIGVTGSAPNNFISPKSVMPGVTVSVTGTLPSVHVSAIDPGLTVSVTGVNQWTTTEMSQIRYKMGIDGSSSAPVGKYAGQLELSLSGVHNIMVENNVNMNQWMALMGAVVAGSSVVNGNNITYYATNNNGIERVSATAVSGARQAIVLFLP